MSTAYEPTIEDLENILEEFHRETTEKELEALFDEYVVNNNTIEEASLAAEVNLEDDEVTLQNQTEAANNAITEALYEADELPNAMRCKKTGKIIAKV